MAKSRATVRWRISRDAFVPLGLLALVALAPLCRADGIPLGKFQFYPSVSMGVVQDDNLFNQNEAVGVGRVSDRTLELEVPLVLQLPFQASMWELAYTPGLKRFQDNSDLDGDTHRLATELDLVFSTGSRLNMRASYTRDYTNLQQAAEQLSESPFTFVDFEILRAHAVYEQPFGQRHGMEAVLDFEKLKFDPAAQGAFTDFSELELTLSYVRLLGRDMRIFAGGVVGTNDLEQPVRISRECSQDPTACSPDGLVLRAEEREDHWTRVGAQVGFERQFDDKNRARFNLGYQVLEFDHSDDSDFSGLVMRLHYRRRLSEILSFSGDALRQPVQSAFDVNNYFVMQSLSVSVDLQPESTSLYYFGTLSIQTNAYPDETELQANREFNRRREDFVGRGIHRRDNIASMDLGVGLQFSALSSIEVTLAARQRDSNMVLDRLEYDDLVFGLTFRYGFVPQRNYI